MAKSNRFDDDDFEDDDDRPKRRRSDDDYDNDDDPAPRKRRRDEDDEDDFDERPRSKPKKLAGKKQNVVALVGMILGIISVALGIPACCCVGYFSTPISIGCGAGGLVCGIIGNKKPYGKGFAMTGMITGFFGILFGITIIVLVIIGMNVKQTNRF